MLTTVNLSNCELFTSNPVQLNYNVTILIVSWWLMFSQLQLNSSLSPGAFSHTRFPYAHA